jgi:hypothetical protein
MLLVGLIVRQLLRWIVEVLKGVDQENEEVQELLLDFQGKMLPESFFSFVHLSSTSWQKF